ncbi:hypothetical protein E1B28_006229 [Marasmius oreades]|uniref:Membrane-associated proteins in eicosanoid and glutathione metabolism n=1 Tax=Marasmius oreades TaxID=181124 RepID=A0A9P7S557_9AGAR|nr:uncharacterized protein E1B28_006229 [Marasmius oreades]KAG7095490.1 hypothetical protein E1B28_006229 [Marasmius oreades]
MTTVIQLQVPEGLPLVGASLLSTVVLLVYQVGVAARARKAAKVPYPQVYADKAQEEASLEAKQFNCAQRAHQNTLEWLPSVYLTSVLTAIKYPKLAAVILAGWSVTRVIYTKAYSTGNPSKREFGARTGFLLQLGLLGTSFSVVGSGVRSYLNI